MATENRRDNGVRFEPRRSPDVQLRAGESPKAGAPLVVALHGCGQTAASYDHGIGWSKLAERLGFALLLPEQKRANNFNRCFGWFCPADMERDGASRYPSAR